MLARDNETLASGFSSDAKLIVSGKRILAVTKSKQAIYVNEIIPPQRAPIKI